VTLHRRGAGGASYPRAVLDTLLATVRAELSDLNDLAHLTRVVMRLLLAAMLGALVGLDRERRGAPAGLRTHMLVAVGCAVFVVVAQQSGFDPEDMSRVLQGLLAGIGFLGAGAVLKSTADGEIHGLTTAASIWATAAIGVTVGLGQEATAILTTGLVLFILAVVLRIERHLLDRRKPRGER
jgi:putative Mg2+ transporter-C (MgtC) family protein